MGCGDRLVERTEQLRGDELGKVRWVLRETYRWPAEAISDAGRHALRAHYEEREASLVGAKSGVTQGGAAAPPPPAVAKAVPGPHQTPRPQPESTGRSGDQPRPSSAEAARPPPQPEEGPVHGPPRPTVWQRHVRPFLGESVGWFIGAFLILSGTLYFVADAWAGMSSVHKAFTVFGFAAGWTLVFAAWARFLGRRPVTEPAARALWRIAFVVAPLASVALGAAADVPLLTLPLLLGWSLVAGVLGAHVGRKSDARAAALLGLSTATATVVLGAAPWLTAGGPAVTWLAVAPAALALLSWRKGPRASGEETAFALLSMAWPVLLVVARLQVALGEVAAPGVHAVTLAVLGLGALSLRAVEGRRAADILSVGVVAAQGALLVPAFLAPAPTFVVAALVAVVTCGALARERASAASARWVFPAYAFGYVAFQRVDQLVPEVVVRAFQALKAALGYAAAPLPASYASVYAALFVVAVGVFAALRYRRAQGAQRAEASALLWATAVGSGFFGLLALLSVGADARPALVACPLLAALGLSLGAWLDRRELTVAGSVVAVAAGLAFAVGWLAALPAGALALALALRSLPASRGHRLPTSVAALALSGLAAVTAFVVPAGPATLLALALASGAALLVARNLDSAELLGLTALGPVLLLLHLGSALLLAAAALAVALWLPARGVASRRHAAALAVVVAAALAPLWTLLAGGAPWLGGEWLLSAGALALVARRALPKSSGPALEAVAILAGLFALVPGPGAARAFPFLTPLLSMLGAAAVALGASVYAAREGRGWRTTLLASGALAVAFWAASQALIGEGDVVALAGPGAVALLATAALLPSVTVPLAAVCLGLALVRAPEHLLVLAAAASLVALLEESDRAWRALLNRARVAWASVVVAAAVLAGAAAWRSEGVPVLAAALVLPALWARATRKAGWAAASVGLTAFLGLRQPGLAALVAPLLAVLWSRVLPAWRPARAFFRHVPGGVGSLVVLAAAVGAAAASAAWLEGPWRLPVLVAWSLALVLLRDRYGVARLSAAALLAVVWPGGHLLASAALLALAFLARHRPAAAVRLLGTSSAAFLPNGAALWAVAVAGAAFAWGAPGAQAMLALALAGAALLLEVPVLLALSAVLPGFELPALFEREALVVSGAAPGVAAALAAVALAARRTALGALLTRAWRALGGQHDFPEEALWWAGLALGAGLGWTGNPVAFVVAALLFVTSTRVEAVLAVALVTGALLRFLPPHGAAVALAATGAALAWAGALDSAGRRVAKAWHHTGWTLGLLGLGLVGADARSGSFAVAWGLAAVTAWAVARALARRWVGWAVTALAAHAVLAFLGLTLATGAPTQLILPWFALASAALASLAWRRTKLNGALACLAVLELLAALALVPGAHPREAVVAVLASLVLGGTLLRAAALEDDEAGAALGPVLLATAVLSARRLGLGLSPGATEAWVAVVLGAALAGAARFLAREGRTRAAGLLRGGAVLWPLLGLLAAPRDDWRALAPLLTAQAAHFAWLSRCGARRLGPVLAAAAFNAAVAVAFLGTGATGVELLALPAGLSVLALLQVFEGELTEATRVRLRAVAMAVIYGATALRPLAFPTTWGLVLCAVTCVVGVGAGVLFRIRSYVLLGTVFLVTTVVATLVRYGVQEPRLGALFLSALGLVVVAVMVVVTTRRAQVQAQVSAMQRLLAQWDA
ncbi:MAG: cobalt-precorrin-5B C(1)-methyltransferase [Myxococcaceae bacterium]